jgi:CDGSH-type Zn-finger protein/uncharacterized Fe-S cluster protein YjdI
LSDKIREYEGKDIVVRYDVKRCIHVAECTGRLPKVFDRDRRPWVDADAADPDEIAEVVVRCPTGALHFLRKDGGAAEAVPEGNTATLATDGPLYVSGDVELIDGDGSLILKDTRVAFCRCGDSRNKPFCDGRHTEAGFRASGDLAESKPVPEDFSPGGKLSVTPLPDGPLRAEGSLEIRSADGRQSSFHSTRVHLCRCGASKKKPFCDGTHKQIDFVAG